MEITTSIIKKFINNKEEVVHEHLEGLCMLNKNIKRIQGTQIVILNESLRKVHLIMGGGSGHEPFPAGLVSSNLLSAAVCGNVFASPSYQEVLTSILNVKNSDEGIILLIANYTGDVINFKLAKTLAIQKGINVKEIILGDDIAFKEDNLKIGNRGLAGSFLIIKILGGASFKGKNLEYVHSLGENCKKQIFTLGIALDVCSLPGNPRMKIIESDQIEFGLGIHGEKGKIVTKYESCDKVIKEIIENYFIKFNCIAEGDEIIVLLNNLGSTTEIEMNIITRSLLLEIEKRKLKILRLIVGKLISSLEMHGISITILNLKFPFEKKDEIIEYIDIECDIPNYISIKPLKINEIYVENNYNNIEDYNKKNFKNNEIIKLKSESGIKLKKSLLFIFENLINENQYLNLCDSEVGDGDLGSGVTKSCKAIIENINYFPFEDNLCDSFIKIGEIIANNCGGTSGLMYYAFFINAANSLKPKLSENNCKNWKNALIAGFNGICEIGGAEIGDRTMIDSLNQTVTLCKNTLENEKEDYTFLKNIVNLVEIDSKNAENLKAQRGRSSYLNGKEIGKKEPGCELILLWMKYLIKSMK